MNRIIVLGSPGAGKSYFSKRLANIINLNLYHLDNIFWKSDRTHISELEFDNKIKEIVKKSSFIIDGNYSRTYNIRIEKADTIFFLDLSLEECLKGINNRIGKQRNDIPFIEKEFDKEFKEFVINFHKTGRDNILKIISKVKNKNVIIFKSRDEYNNYLDNLNIVYDIRKEVEQNVDLKNQIFVAKLIPNININTIKGLKSPLTKDIAKRYLNRVDLSNFLKDLPHKYFEEYIIHDYIISNMKNYDDVINEINNLLPYIDNWSTCDSINPKIFGKNKDRLLNECFKWIRSKNIYTVRFGIHMFMSYFLDDSFDIKYALEISNIKSDEYYLNMMISWYFATALAKQYDAILPIIEEKRLSKFVQNKSIQKAIESFRISLDKKKYLKTLKIK